MILSLRAPSVGAATLLLGLAFAPAVLAADPVRTAPPQTAQTAALGSQQAEPAMPPAAAPHDVPFNPNTVPPWSALRNGAGEVIDRHAGVPAAGYGANDGGF